MRDLFLTKTMEEIKKGIENDIKETKADNFEALAYYVIGFFDCLDKQSKFSKVSGIYRDALSSFIPDDYIDFGGK